MTLLRGAIFAVFYPIRKTLFHAFITGFIIWEVQLFVTYKWHLLFSFSKVLSQLFHLGNYGSLLILATTAVSACKLLHVQSFPGFTDKEINRRNEKALSHFGLGIPSPNMLESELCTGCNMCKWLFCINLVFLAKVQLFTGKRPPGF